MSIRPIIVLVQLSVFLNKVKRESPSFPEVFYTFIQLLYSNFMDIIFKEAREPNDDFWRISGVLGPTKWTKDPFIILQERSEASLMKERLEELDQQIKIEQMYTEPM